MWCRYEIPPKSWVDDIVVGSVVRMKSGRLRTAILVRRVDTHRGPRVWAVYFPILHCSWTKRGHTTINRSDLRARGLAITQAKIDVLGHPLLRRVQLDALGPYPDGWDANHDGSYVVDGSGCCCVVGVVE